MLSLSRTLAVTFGLTLAAISAGPQSPAAINPAPDLSVCMAKLHPGTEITMHAKGHGKVMVGEGKHYKNVDAVTTTEMVRTVKSISPGAVTFDVAALETVRLSESGKIYRQKPIRTQQTMPLRLESTEFKRVGEEDVEAFL
jgi:hypothetical protein